MNSSVSLGVGCISFFSDCPRNQQQRHPLGEITGHDQVTLLGKFNSDGRHRPHYLCYTAMETEKLKNVKVLYFLKFQIERRNFGKIILFEKELGHLLFKVQL